MEQIFSQYVPLRVGLGPYQIPSYALEMVIATYLKETSGEEHKHGRRLTRVLPTVFAQDLTENDIYFTEEGAFQVAAGTYFCGLNQEIKESRLIRDVFTRVWKVDTGIKERFPYLEDLSPVENIMVWAKTVGCRPNEPVESYLNGLEPFPKRQMAAELERDEGSLGGLQQPQFEGIGFDPDDSMDRYAEIAEVRYRERKREVRNRRHPLVRWMWDAHRERRGRESLLGLPDEILDL